MCSFLLKEEFVYKMFIKLAFTLGNRRSFDVQKIAGAWRREGMVRLCGGHRIYRIPCEPGGIRVMQEACVQKMEAERGERGGAEGLLVRHGPSCGQEERGGSGAERKDALEDIIRMFI